VKETERGDNSSKGGGNEMLQMKTGSTWVKITKGPIRQDYNVYLPVDISIPVLKVQGDQKVSMHLMITA
jgi:hypothetical protein